VRNIFAMNVAQAINDLLENLLCDWFLKLAALSNVIKYVASSAQLHHDHNMLLRFDGLVNFDDVGVAKFQQQIDFFQELDFLVFVV